MAHSIFIRELAAIAATQDGVVSSDDLALLGVSRDQLARRVAAGWLEKAAPRVYRIAGSPETHRQRLRIGLLSLGERSWVSYEAAASLHRLDRSRPTVEFTVLRGERWPRGPFTVHTTTFFEAADGVCVDGLRTLSATRTIIDLAHARARRSRVEAAIDSAIRLELSHPVAIADRLASLRGSGRWGCRLIDRLLPDSGGHSPLERAFLRLVREAGIERPRTQVIHRDAAGRHVARVDFEFTNRRLIVEVTGRLGHVSDAERERDAQRRNELQTLGFTVIEYTSTQVFDRPWLVLADLSKRLT